MMAIGARPNGSVVFQVTFHLEASDAYGSMEHCSGSNNPALGRY